MKRHETNYDPGVSWAILPYLHAELKTANARSYDGRIILFSARTKRACRHMATMTDQHTH